MVAMKTEWKPLLATLLLVTAVLMLIFANILIHRQIGMWDDQLTINKALINCVEALEKENKGQWKRISELKLMLCNPDLIKCGK